MVARGFASDPRRLNVDFARAAIEAIWQKLVNVGSEGIRFDDVGAGANVFGMDLAHEVGGNQIQFIVGTVDVDAL